MARHAFVPPCGFDIAATTIRDLAVLDRIAFWGYRLVLHPDATLFVHEAYYEADESLLGFASAPTRLCGESVEVVREELRRMEEALHEPVLSYGDYGELDGHFTRYGWDGGNGSGIVPGGPRTN